MATSDLEIEGQGHKTIAFVALPIYTHIPNLKVLTKIFFKLSRPKGNLCGGGVTVLNPKYPRLSSGDTNINFLHLMVSEIQPGQSIIGQGHYSKVKSRSHHDVAHLQD